ncbi:unnamed protein product [Heterobilharzia americana]|nr:unnamed protein product [Heterobilharzia americana]
MRLNILFPVDSSMILPQSLQRLRSSSFGSLTRQPFFHSAGIFPSSQTFCNSCVSISAVVSASVFSASGGISPGPAFFPGFSNFMTFRTSLLLSSEGLHSLIVLWLCRCRYFWTSCRWWSIQEFFQVVSPLFPLFLLFGN